ncbi:MAG TPA: hypothetical protein VGD79_05780 [Thermoanaerobaculia bacterium]
MLRILILSLAVLTAFVPFVPAIIFATMLVAFAITFAAHPIVRAETRCDDQPVALLALVSFRAPPAFA